MKKTLSFKRCMIVGLLIVLFQWPSYAQTQLKANALTSLVAVPQVGLETGLTNHLTFQVDLTTSFWKSVNNAPAQLYMLVPEVRWYPNKLFSGFFIGMHTGGAYGKVQKPQYKHTDYYQQGWAYMLGGTVGVQWQWTPNLQVEVFLGGGSVQSFYKGYSSLTGERLDGAVGFNKSGEWMVYRGGIMLGIWL